MAIEKALNRIYKFSENTPGSLNDDFGILPEQNFGFELKSDGAVCTSQIGNSMTGMHLRQTITRMFTPGGEK
jgi:hypothetical protein